MKTLQVPRTCHYHGYRQEALDESIGSSTNDLALCNHPQNGKGIATPTKHYYFTRYVLHFA